MHFPGPWQEAVFPPRRASLEGLAAEPGKHRLPRRLTSLRGLLYKASLATLPEVYF